MTENNYNLCKEYGCIACKKNDWSVVQVILITVNPTVTTEPALMGNVTDEDETEDDSKQNGLSAGAIIGVAVGVVVLMMMVVAVAIVKCYGRPSTRHTEDIELSSRGLSYSLGSFESEDELFASTMVTTTTGVSQ